MYLCDLCFNGIGDTLCRLASQCLYTFVCNVCTHCCLHTLYVLNTVQDSHLLKKTKLKHGIFHGRKVYSLVLESISNT